MNPKNFEEWLMFRHAQENPEILDDMLPDMYEDWLEGLGTDELIEYGDKYAKDCVLRYQKGQA